MQGKELDLSIIISPKEISQSIGRKLHFIGVAKLLHLSILYCYVTHVERRQDRTSKDWRRLPLTVRPLEGCNACLIHEYMVNILVYFQ